MRALHVLVAHPAEAHRLRRDAESRRHPAAYDSIFGMQPGELMVVTEPRQAEGLRFTSFSLTQYAEHEVLSEGPDARRLREVMHVLYRNAQKTRYARMVPWGQKFSSKMVVDGEQVRSSREAEKQTLIATIRNAVEKATGGKLKVDEHHDVHQDKLTFTATFQPDDMMPMMVF